MSTEQPADPAQSEQPRSFVGGEANPIVDSILARTRWAQRALSPWTQRWLAQPAAAFGRRIQPLTFTVGATQQTLGRVQAQYRSHSSRPVSEEANTLPLVGTLPQPQPSAEAAPSEASGPYSRPFNSLEDFLTAIEANKDRAETAPPPVASPKPAAKRTQGPYSKAFNSLEEFMKAAEAARARDYAPPPPEEVVSPRSQPQHETPRYVHAFNSFEEFAKAAEESRQQWGYAATQEPKPEPVAPPLGKIRAMSRVEELPARGSSTLADVSPASLVPSPSFEPEPAESFSLPDQAPTTIAPIEALPPQFDSATPAVTPTAARPAVIPAFSPAKARGGKQSQASASQPVHRKGNVAAERPATIETPPVMTSAPSVTPSNETVSLSPESFVEPAVPFVQQQAAESAPVPGTYETTPPEAHSTSWPSAESATTQANIPAQHFTGESMPAAVPTRAPVSVAPAAQITAAGRSVSQGRPAAISSAPSIQRAVAEPARDEIESFSAEPTIQRHVDEAPAMVPAAMTAPEEESLPTATSESTPARLDMPLAQRKVAQAQPVTAASPTVQRQADEAPLLAPAAAIEEESLSTITSESMPVQRKVTQTQPATNTAPTVQRHVDEAPSLAPTAADALEEESLSTTASESMPVQRKVAQAQPATNTAPTVQRHVDEAPSLAPTAASAIEEESLPASASESMPTQSDMPLVQRKVGQAKPTPATSPTVQRQADEVPLLAPAVATALEEEVLSPASSESVPVQRKATQMQPATTTAPVVQRHVGEAPSPGPTAAAAVEEESLPTTPAASMPAQVDRPLVQRKVAQVQAAPATPSVAQRQADEASLMASAAEDAVEEESLPTTPAASMPAQVDMPLVQRKAAQAQPAPVIAPAVQRQADEASLMASAVEEESLPTSTSASVPAQTDMPLVQRKVTQAQPAPVTAPVVQRQADEASLIAPAVEEEPLLTTPSASMPAQADMPLVQRKVAQAQPAPVTAPVVQRQADEASLMASAVEEESLPTSTSASVPAQTDMPLVQRKVTQAQPAPVTAPVVQRQADEASLIAPAVKEEPLLTTPSASMPAQPDMPLVQRKSDKAKPAPATSPVVQRHADEAPLMAPAAESAIEEKILPTAASKATPVHSVPSVPPVQRSMTAIETNAPAQWSVESSQVREALPSAKIMSPARSDMPLVQRQVADSQPLEEESLQRRVTEPASPTAAASVPAQAAVNISDRILARMTSHEQLPAAKLPDLPLHQPVIQRISASEVKPALESSKSQFVPAAIQRTPGPVIQRMPAEPSAAAPNSGLIQRVETIPAESAPTEAAAPMDLDNLARQVYPIIKHMLAVERERRSSR